ncbi:MAG: calcium-binding protein [Sphingomonadaceae bacterium]|nr:calcium-binding protein [Sphingomonadaceae bacterium]
MPNFPGTPGDDFFFGTDDPETISGIGGNDFLHGSGGGDLISGGTGDDNLFGGLGDDTIRGGGGNDFLSGDGGADDLRGGEGDDTLEADFQGSGEYAFDRLRGGGGADQFRFHVMAPGSHVNVADFVVDFEGAGAPSGDVLKLELPFGEDARLVYGGRANANVQFAANDGIIEVYFGEDNGDTAVFADSNDDGVFTPDDLYLLLDGVHALTRADFGDTEFALVGGPGDDSIEGTRFDEPVFGLGGNDTLDGAGGGDEVEGGEGDDSLDGGRGIDLVDGGQGNDTLDGGKDRDFVTGSDGDDSVRGGAKDDNVSGGDGDDLVYGDAGDDNVDGDEGNDTTFGGAGGDDLVAGDGHDLLFGEAGDDFLQGGEGRDTMEGGEGDDEIVGYEDRDINTGGAGDDTFGFFLGSFAPSSTFAARDVVTDFEGAGAVGGDLIDLNGEQLAFAGEINVRPVAGAALPGAGDGVRQLVYTQYQGNTYLIADENDDGLLDADDFFVRFEGLHDFTTADFDNTDFVTVGTAGDDTIRGTQRPDKIFGGGGDDSLIGRGAEDELHGGDGRDTLEGGPGGFDSLFGEQGADLLSFATSDGGNADGGTGNDTLIGSDVEFSFTRLNGGRGDDELRAGAEDATLIGDDGADQLIGGVGDDGLSGGLDESFNLDGDQDLFVYGADPWGSDTVFDFEDGVDLFDMSATGLAFEDLTIDDSNDFQTVISSSLGMITISHFDPVTITEADFIF